MVLVRHSTASCFHKPQRYVGTLTMARKQVMPAATQAFPVDQRPWSPPRADDMLPETRSDWCMGFGRLSICIVFLQVNGFFECSRPRKEEPCR